MDRAKGGGGSGRGAVWCLGEFLGEIIPTTTK